jgi:UDP-N-acetylmuramyl pentapeptide phosphotransferase/UDP-N-acetylglucosamine-1-phosphate transferase
MQAFLSILAVLVSAVLLALLLVPLAKRFARRFGLIDEPEDRRIHKDPVPRSGGLAVFLAIHLPCAVYFLIINPVSASSVWIHLFIGSFLLLLIGLLDDWRGLKAWTKLGGQVAVALLMFYFGFSLKGLLGVDLPLLVDLFATIFWFILLINAFNLIDGMDGACGGIGLISAVGMAIIMLYFGEHDLALILFALAGACLGFLRYNFHPASIFLGDCGSMLIGFLLAGISLRGPSRQSALITLLVPLLTAGVPIFDVIVAVWRRIARKMLARIHNDPSACKIFGPDLEHLHHKLMSSGITQRRAAMILYASAASACLLAFICVAFSSLRFAFLVAGVTLLLHVATRQIVRTELYVTTQALLKGVSRPRAWVRDTLLVTADIFWLMLSALAGLLLAPGETISAVKFFGIVLIPFATLYFFGAYKILWSRSRISQMLTLSLELLSGILLVLCFLWVFDQVVSRHSVIFVWHYYQLALIGLVILRTAPRILRDFGSKLSMHDSAESKRNALILGGGAGTILFFRRKAAYDYDRHNRNILGVIDDDPRLTGRKVYGYHVLGNLDQLEDLIKKYHVRELILTENEQDPVEMGLNLLKEKYDLRIFRFEMRVHVLTTAEAD